MPAELVAVLPRDPGRGSPLFQGHGHLLPAAVQFRDREFECGVAVVRAPAAGLKGDSGFACGDPQAELAQQRIDRNEVIDRTPEPCVEGFCSMEVVVGPALQRAAEEACVHQVEARFLQFQFWRQQPCKGCPDRLQGSICAAAAGQLARKQYAGSLLLDNDPAGKVADPEPPFPCQGKL